MLSFLSNYILYDIIYIILYLALMAQLYNVAVIMEELSKMVFQTLHRYINVILK